MKRSFSSVGSLESSNSSTSALERYQNYVQRAKCDLWSQLSSRSNLGYLSKVESDIRGKLDIAFKQRLSTSLLVVGPDGSGKKRIIETVLHSYADGNNQIPFSIARVQPHVCPSDHDALCSIANQLSVRGSSDKNLVLALEDLEDHFRCVRACVCVSIYIWCCMDRVQLMCGAWALRVI